MRTFDMIIGGSPVSQGSKVTIRSPYDGREVGQAAFAGPEDVELAIQSALDSFPIISGMPAYKRCEILRSIARGISEHSDELSEIICDEAGKPIRFAEGEVKRAGVNRDNANRR